MLIGNASMQECVRAYGSIKKARVCSRILHLAIGDKDVLDQTNEISIRHQGWSDWMIGHGDRFMDYEIGGRRRSS